MLVVKTEIIDFLNGYETYERKYVPKESIRLHPD